MSQGNVEVVRRIFETYRSGDFAALVVRAWPVSRLASLLLVPYALWLAFATALTWAIWARN